MEKTKNLESISKFGFNLKTSKDGGADVFAYSSRNNPKKRGRQSSRKKTNLNIVSIHNWSIKVEKNRIQQNISATLDLHKLYKNLFRVLEQKFGTKSSVSLNYDGMAKYSLVIKQRRPSSVEDLRGYNGLPFEWENPDGVFSCQIKFDFSGSEVSAFVTKYFLVGYAHESTIKHVFEAICSCLGVSEYRQKAILSGASLNEIKVPVEDLIAAAINAKDSERKELLDILFKNDVASSTPYFTVESIEDEMSLKIKSQEQADGYVWNNEIPLSVLESRESSEYLKDFDQNIIKASFNFKLDSFDESNLVVEKGIIDRICLVTLLKGHQILPKSLLLKQSRGSLIFQCYDAFVETLTDSRLSKVSNLISNFISIYGDVDSFPEVTVCLSEIFGDLWRTSNTDKSEMSYRRALDLGGDELRLHRKLLSLFVDSGNKTNAKEALDVLIDLEPRNTEKSKYLLQRSVYSSDDLDDDEKINFLRQAYSTDRINFDVLIALLGELMRKGKYAELVSLTEDHIGKYSSKVGKNRAAKILAEEANAWLNGLARPDIAYSKAKEALELGTSDLEIKILFAEITKKLGLRQEYLDTLEECLEVAESIDDTNLVNELNQRLTNEYGGVDYIERRNQELKLKKWTQILHESGGVYRILESIATREEFSFVFEEIISSFLALRDDSELTDSFAAEICAKFPESDIPTKLFTELLRKGYVSNTGFNYLRDLFSSNWDKSDLSKLFKVRLDVTQDVFERLSLTEDFFKEELSVSEEFDEKLLANLLTAETYDLAAPILQKNIISYEANRNSKGLVRLIYVIRDSELGYFRKRAIYTEILKSLDNETFSGKTDIFEQFIEEIAIKSENPPEYIEEMIKKFRHNISDKKLHELTRIVFEDESYDINNSIDYESILKSDPELLSKYYLKVAILQDDLNLAIAYLAKANINTKYHREKLVDVLNAVSEKPSKISVKYLNILKRLTAMVGLPTVLETVCSYWLLQDIEDDIKNDVKNTYFSLKEEAWTPEQKYSWLLSKVRDRNWSEFAKEKLINAFAILPAEERSRVFDQLLSRKIIAIDEMAELYGDYGWFSNIMYTYFTKKVKICKTFSELQFVLTTYGKHLKRSDQKVLDVAIEKSISILDSGKLQDFIHMFSQISTFGNLNVISSMYQQSIEDLQLSKDMCSAIFNSIASQIKNLTPSNCAFLQLMATIGHPLKIDQTYIFEKVMAIPDDFSETTLSIKYLLLSTLEEDEMRYQLLTSKKEGVQLSCKLDKRSPFDSKLIEDDFASLRDKYTVKETPTHAVMNSSELQKGDNTSRVNKNDEAISESSHSEVDDEVESSISSVSAEFNESSESKDEFRPIEEHQAHEFSDEIEREAAEFEQSVDHIKQYVDDPYDLEQSLAEEHDSAVPNFDETIVESEAVQFDDTSLEQNEETDHEKKKVDFSETIYETEDAWANLPESTSSLEAASYTPSIHEVYDWRKILKTNSVDQYAIERLLKSKNEQLDKHVGIQALGLITGDVKALNNWPMAVWRNFYYAYYPKEAEGRFPDDAISKNILTPQAKTIVELNTFFVRAHANKIVIQGLANILDISVDEIKSKREGLDWSSGVLDRSGLGLFKDMFDSKRYKVFHIDGLSKKIFFDANERSFYIDKIYYGSVPPSHLFARILEKYWAIRLRYFAFLELNPKLEAKHALRVLSEQLGKSSFSILSKQDPLEKSCREFIDNVGKKNVEKYLKVLSGIKSADLASLQHNFKAHLYKIILAQSLDFVGLCESISDRNLISHPVNSLEELLNLSRYMQPLVRFMLKMNLDGDSNTNYNGVA